MNFQQLQSLMHHVAKRNTDHEHLNSFFLDPASHVALAGYRRSFGLGDMLLRVTTPQLDMGTLPQMPGLWFYQDSSYDTTAQGLPGKMTEGGREFVDAGLAQDKFANVYHHVTEGGDGTFFSLLLNPKMVIDFIDDNTIHQGFEDRKINIQVMAPANIAGWFTAMAEEVPCEPGVTKRMMRLAFPRQGLPMGMPNYAEIDFETSLVPYQMIKPGTRYVVEFSKQVGDQQFVRVMNVYKPGIRMAIQHFRSGLLMPQQERYSVYAKTNNGIVNTNIAEFPFIEGQSGDFKRSPMIIVDLDTLDRALRPMLMFKRVEMLFKNSITGIIIRSLPQEGDNGIAMDALVGPTSPYKSGKVYTA